LTGFPFSRNLARTCDRYSIVKTPAPYGTALTSSTPFARRPSRFPFRLGTTSFIHPGGWAFNVERLAARVEDIEILCFESDGLPTTDEARQLANLKARHALTYSLHTPLDASLASEDEARRLSSVAAVQRTIEAAAAFAPEVAIVHVYLGDHEHDRAPTDLAAWRRRAARSLEALLAAGIPARDLCIEVLDYDFALIEPVVVELGLSIALDVGHLVRDGRDELALLRRHFARTRVIQWHGTDATGRDHRGLDHYPRDRARSLFDTLIDHDYRGVLTLEVFREADLDASLALVASLVEGA
jgi:sugar phosphate isomerase/epimerase